jgi:hypothetical protein
MRRVLSCGLVALPLIVWILILCLAPRPLIIFARGFDSGPYLLMPVRQRPLPPPLPPPDEIGSVAFWLRGTFQFLEHVADPQPDWSIRNWTGEELYVDGCCIVCGKPWAPRGSFVLAMLPAGPAYFKHDGDKKHEHMSGPNYLPTIVVWVAAIAGTLALIGASRSVVKRRSV